MLKVVVAVTSPVAFELLGDVAILQTSLSVAGEFVAECGLEATLAIAIKDPAKVLDFTCEVIECDPNTPKSFAEAIAKSAPCDFILIHDALRPFTSKNQYYRVVDAIGNNLDAVRATEAFTETLKAISIDNSVIGTIDRTTIERISTPEIFRFSAIDFSGNVSNWFLPLNQNATTANVGAEPESRRINSVVTTDVS